MEDLQFRKELIEEEINANVAVLERNSEFIRLFHNNNLEILHKIKRYYMELAGICKQIEKTTVPADEKKEI